jgi:DNA-binding CsgD family transcriptional regulator
MINKIHDYSLFFKFVDTFTPVGFVGIDQNDPLMVELEKMMLINDQFFYVADIIQIQVLFTSKRSTEMIGVSPDMVNPYYFMKATHPDDIQRLNIGRAKLIRMAQDLFIAEKGNVLLSTNFKIRNAAGAYSNFLIQNYLFYSTIPYKTVFFLKIHTNIDWCKKMKHGYHYYIGNNLCYLKYPDEELLSMGNIFSHREFEIIQMIGQGLSTIEIAEKLFLSQYTVNTHRGNILKKTGKAHISELIYELQERGLL